MTTTERKSALEEWAAGQRAREAEDLNIAAQAHVNYAHFRVPVDKGSLQKTIRQTETATPDNPRATVQAGGVTDDGFVVDYAEPVNFGTHHELANGTVYDIAPDPFWTEAEEVGRQTMTRRGDVTEREGRKTAPGRASSTYGLEQ